jgi:hypothetical protein
MRRIGSEANGESAARAPGATGAARRPGTATKVAMLARMPRFRGLWQSCDSGARPWLSMAYAMPLPKVAGTFSRAESAADSLGCVCCRGATLAGGRKPLRARQLMDCIAPHAHTHDPPRAVHAQAAEHPAPETMPRLPPNQGASGNRQRGRRHEEPCPSAPGVAALYPALRYLVHSSRYGRSFLLVFCFRNRPGHTNIPQKTSGSRPEENLYVPGCGLSGYPGLAWSSARVSKGR